MISVIPRKTIIVVFRFRKFWCCKSTSLKKIPSQCFTFIYLFIYLSIYLFIYLSIYLFIYSFIYLFICLFFWSLTHFLRIGIKNNSRRIAQNILSKEVKETLQKRGGGTGVVMELLKKTKWAISKIFVYIFSQYSEWVFVLMVFRWTGTRSGG